MTYITRRYHHSGHDYTCTWGFLEVLNEIDLLNEITGPKHIRWYDGVVKVVHKNHPDIKFIGNCHARQGSSNNSWVWRQFLDRDVHASDAPWPIDAVSFHGCESFTLPLF